MSVVLYMPVVHKGYVSFLDNHREEDIYILSDSISKQYKPLRKDIRSLEPAQVVAVVQALGLGKTVILADKQVLNRLNSSEIKIAMPDEEPMSEVAKMYFPQATVLFESVSLRWDAKKTLEEEKLDEHQQVSSAASDVAFMELAKKEAAKSSDQWRQVGAVLVKNGQVLYAAHNHHLPDNHQPLYQGDLRGNFSKGQHIDLTTAQHAEASIVAQAAKDGVSIAGASFYITTFPCPVCAKLVSETGVKQVFFAEGYAMIDGKRVLEEAGIELVRVNT